MTPVNTVTVKQDKVLTCSASTRNMHTWKGVENKCHLLTWVLQVSVHTGKFADAESGDRTRGICFSLTGGLLVVVFTFVYRHFYFMCVCQKTCGCQKKAAYPLELELKGSWELTWVLRTDSRSSGRAISALYCWAIFLAQYFSVVNLVYIKYTDQSLLWGLLQEPPVCAFESVLAITWLFSKW